MFPHKHLQFSAIFSQQVSGIKYFLSMFKLIKLYSNECNMKKTKLLLLVVSIAIVAIVSCKTVGRIAAKYWLNREIKEFVGNCEDKTSFIVGKENAHKYCDCAVDMVAEEYQNYQDSKKLSVSTIIDFINKCK